MINDKHPLKRIAIDLEKSINTVEKLKQRLEELLNTPGLDDLEKKQVKILLQAIDDLEQKRPEIADITGFDVPFSVYYTREVEKAANSLPSDDSDDGAPPPPPPPPAFGM